MSTRRTWSVVAALSVAASTVAASAVAVAANLDDGTAAILESPPPAKRAALETNLVSPIVGTWGLSFETMPVEHHALVLSGAYVHATNSSNPQAQPPVDGFGFELAYRQYSGRRGPRGVFAGPSLLVGGYRLGVPEGSTAAKTNLLSIGGAFDVGYQAIVGDVVLALGVGVQYTHLDKDVPPLAYPATIYANGGLRPRALVTVGWAF